MRSQLLLAISMRPFILSHFMSFRRFPEVAEVANMEKKPLQAEGFI